jgi:hypothetical protein
MIESFDPTKKKDTDILPAHSVEECEMNEGEELMYLDLKGDLHWLKPYNSEIMCYPTGGATAPVTQPVREPLPPKAMTKMHDDAQSLGLTLPPAFQKFFINQELMHRMLPDTAGNFVIRSSRLCKVPAAYVKGAGGYCISMYEDINIGDTVFLCLLPDGTHCVLSYGAPRKYYPTRDENHSKDEKVQN